MLKPEGTITIEFPHVLKMFENNEFDTIYHEHFFYFSIYSLKTILFKHQLSIYDIDELDTHGGSLRVYVTHLGNSIDLNSDKSIVAAVVDKLPLVDIKTILKAFETDYGLDTKVKLESKNCGGVSILELPINSNFFGVS